MLKAVIFDLDGLLVDSTPLQLEANKLFIESLGKIYLIPESGREGMRIIDIIRDYKDIFDLPGSVTELYRKRQDIYFKLVRGGLELFPGALSLLQKLKSKNYRLALATSGDRKYVDLVRQKFTKLSGYFSVIVTGDDVVRGKPYPDIYQKALKKLGFKPGETIVIEDSLNGILAAKAADIQVICVPNKHYPDVDYSLADMTFISLKDIVTAIP